MPDDNDRPVACCPSCGAPLIATFAFRKYEFYCLECGAHVEFLRPRALPPTPELLARYDALKAEWDANVGDRLILDGGYRRDCEKCTVGGQQHRTHATEEEMLAHAAALGWLARRASAQPIGGR